MNDYNTKSNAIRVALELDIDKDNLDELTGKINKLINLIGLSAELKAGAIKYLRESELIAYAKYKSEKLPPTVLKIVIDGETAEQKAKLEYVDRLNAGLVHAIDGLRTIISLKKTEMDKSI